MLRKVENPRTEHFDSFSQDTNPDKVNRSEEEKVQSDEEEEDGEEKETTITDTNTEKPNPSGEKTCRRTEASSKRTAFS